MELNKRFSDIEYKLTWEYVIATKKKKINVREKFVQKLFWLDRKSDFIR